MIRASEYTPIKVTGEGVAEDGQLLNFCDEFTEFNDYCAFFCDAAALIVANNDLIDKETTQGLKRYAQSLKDKSHYLKLWLQQIQAGK